MTQPLIGQGFLDHVSFLPRVAGQGGFLMVRGWFSLLNDRTTAVTAILRVADQAVAIPCRQSRPDVDASNPRLAVDVGFDAVVAIETDLPDPSGIHIAFSAHAVPCGELAGAIQRPDLDVERAAERLSPLRLRKLRNLVLNERERLSMALDVRSLPVAGQIDPAFHCNLECPLCLSEMIRQDGYTMPVMQPTLLEQILASYGDTLVRIWLSLWGEPLLNRNLADMIARCKRHEIWVMISTNMSVPLSDERIDALVRSGLDSVVLSIDGATQENYEKYRKKGDLALVLDNVTRFVATKRRLGSRTPHLYWRMLEFPWNRHEIEAARALAATVGVDKFGVEPGILPDETNLSKQPRPAEESAQTPPPETLGAWRRMAQQRSVQHEYFGCDYLYSSISVNANGMVHPCCYVVSPSDAVGDARSEPAELRNNALMRGNRRMFAQYAAASEKPPTGYSPCLSCGVVTARGGHVITQTNFETLYGYLMHGDRMDW